MNSLPRRNSFHYLPLQFIVGRRFIGAVTLEGGILFVGGGRPAAAAAAAFLWTLPEVLLLLLLLLLLKILAYVLFVYYHASPVPINAYSDIWQQMLSHLLQFRGFYFFPSTTVIMKSLRKECLIWRDVTEEVTAFQKESWQCRAFGCVAVWTCFKHVFLSSQPVGTAYVELLCFVVLEKSCGWSVTVPSCNCLFFQEWKRYPFDWTACVGAWGAITM